MHVCVELTDGREPPSSAGGKARSLVRLAQAGLAVPRAFVVTEPLFRALRDGGPPLPARLEASADIDALERAAAALRDAPLPAAFLAELDQQLDRLADDAGVRPFLTPPARFSVRSSFAGEDRRGALGAGVYASVVGVERAGVPAAIRQVLASALSPGAVAYAGARGDGASHDGGARAVLIHRYLEADASGSAAWDPRAAAPPVVEVATGVPTATAGARVDAAVRALAARMGPTEIEWVARGDDVIFVQLRGYDPPRELPRWAGQDQLDGGGDWRWDAAHNPLPLSPAQAGLIALVEARCRIGVRQRVAGGYLFYAPGGEPPARAIAPAAAADELARLSSTVDRHLGSPASGGDSPERALEDALAFFVSVYDPLFGVIQPALRRCRDMLSTFLRDNDAAALDAIPTLLGGVESIAAERGRRAARLRRARSGGERAAALGDYLSRFGDESPVWDVAQPTYREDPAPLFAWLAPEDDAAPAASPPPAGDPAWSRAAREVEGRLPQPARARFAALLALARTAVALGEEDDFVYSRVQAAVRAALLGVGRRLVASGLLPEAADIFWLPLDTVRAPAGAGAPSSSALAAALAAARDQHRRALASPPPGAEARARGGAAVRGKAASGGRAIGRAWVHTNARADGAAPRAGDAMGPGAAAIVVAATLLPAELPLLRAAGLVVETGGILGHVAAQARERGIPAVVGATGACAAIATGDLLLVDGDAGIVIKIAGGTGAIADGSTDGLYRDTVPR